MLAVMLSSIVVNEKKNTFELQTASKCYTTLISLNYNSYVFVAQYDILGSKMTLR